MFRRLIVSRGSCALVLHQFNFFDGCEDFVAPVAHALVRAASTLVSTLGVISHRLRLRRPGGAANLGCRRLSDVAEKVSSRVTLERFRTSLLYARRRSKPKPD